MSIYVKNGVSRTTFLRVVLAYYWNIFSMIMALKHMTYVWLAALPPSALKMEDCIRSKLNTKVLKRVANCSRGESNAGVYETDAGKIFIKCSFHTEARLIFEGELESLKELSRTGTVRVPKPLFVGSHGRQCFIITEYLNMTSLLKYSSRLGTLLAELHLNNIKKLNKRKSGFVNPEFSVADKFGFHVPTACGYIPQSNEWSSDWVNFYMEQKLEKQINLVLLKDGNREINELWSHLQLKTASFFKGMTVEPSLLHGDLWIGNSGETKQEPVVFDPACFYGHHEYDLAIAAMFYGFDKTFFDSYHISIPRTPGFKERHQLYLLFHHLNHWNHFGSHKESSLKIMRNLAK